jgi:hypothetical protein
MIQDEKDNLLSLFAREENWCQEVEARDQQGEPVRFDDEAAVAWDLVGALCHLFGWSRASKLFVQIIRRITGPSYRWTSQDRAMAAMRALQDFNDRQETTYETIVATLRDMPVWTQARNQTLNN